MKALQGGKIIQISSVRNADTLVRGDRRIFATLDPVVRHPDAAILMAVGRGVRPGVDECEVEKEQDQRRGRDADQGCSYPPGRHVYVI